MNVNVKFDNGEIKNVDKNLLYDSSLITGNTIIVGKPETGKTAYVCRCLKQGFFPGIKEIYYIAPSETLTNKRVDELYKIFSDYELFIYHADNKDSLENCLQQIKDVVNQMVNEENNLSESEIDEPSEGEKPEISRLMLLDDMSCIADRSQSFANFITRARKLCFCVVTIFHDISCSSGVWSLLNSTSTRFILFTVGNPTNISSFLSKFQVDKASRDGIRYSSKKFNWLYNTYVSEVKYVGDHMMIDTNTGDKELNDGSLLGYVRTKTGGIWNENKKSFEYNKQYIHKNAGKGNHSSYVCGRARLLNDKLKSSKINKRKVIFCVNESISLTEGGQTFRSSSIVNLTSSTSLKRTAEEIDNLCDSNPKIKKSVENIDNSDNKVDQKGGSIPIYLRSRWGAINKRKSM